MPIQSSDILYKLSVTTGSSGNYQAQANVNNSLGKYISITQTVDNTLNNLFNDITGSGNAMGQVDYRCIFVHNNHATLTLVNATAYFSSTGSGQVTKALGVDPSGVSIVGAGELGPQAATIANAFSAPAGVSFSTPITQATGVSLGNIPAGSCCAIWLRRTATNSLPAANDGCTIGIGGDTL